jgi:4-hydroxy-tetrahydrodipicolinate reductase
MGRELLRLATENPRLRVVGAIVKRGSPLRGVALRESPDAGKDIAYSDSFEAASEASVLIDFSVAIAFDEALAFARSRRIAFVSGTTGLSALQQRAMQDAAVEIPVLWSANFSLGVAVLARLAREAARALATWDCEIAEAHHRNKKDAPSGTALALGRAVAEARGADFDHVAERDRTMSRRDADSIGFAVLRAGDIIGEHKVLFAGEGERIELVHRATDRSIFARGALEAAIWIARQPAGFHELGDVLGLVPAEPLVR